MDLAKIRKKSLQAVNKPDNEHIIASTAASVLDKDTFEIAPVAPAAAEIDFCQNESFSPPSASLMTTEPLHAAQANERIASTCSPLEAILAGRSAAGCDVESILAEDVSMDTTHEACLEFLCFRVSDEIYGINIMDIKEITKPREVTEVPRAPIFVSGVLSLRGTIIPIIDMRIRLGLAHEEPTGKERIIVIKNNNSFSGLLVDEVIQVVRVQLGSVEAAPTVLEGIDRDFVSGLGRADGRLIIILNLENIADINLY